MVKDFLKGFLALVRDPGEDWGFRERRNRVRVHCNYRCMYALKNERISGSLIDLGEDGMRLASEEPLSPGQTLTVFCPFVDLEGPCRPVEAVVRWTRPGAGKLVHFSGLQYAGEGHLPHDSWVAGVLGLLGFSENLRSSKRRWVRADCTLPGRLGEQAIELQNLGLGGALVRCDHKLPCGPVNLSVGPLDKLAILQIDQAQLSQARGEDEGYIVEFPELNDAQIKLLGVYLKRLLGHSWNQAH